MEIPVTRRARNVADVPRRCLSQQKVSVVVEAVNYARSGCHISEEQAASGGSTQGWWKDQGGISRRHECRVNPERRSSAQISQHKAQPAQWRTLPKARQATCRCRQERRPGNCGHRSCRWRDCGDGLRKSLHGRALHAAIQLLRDGLRHIAGLSALRLFFTQSRRKCGYDIGSTQMVQGVFDPTEEASR
jgi:hypothetical protein